MTRRARLTTSVLISAAASCLFVATASQVEAGPIGPDAAVLQYFESARTPALTRVMLAVTWLGNSGPTIGLTLLVAAWLFFRGRTIDAWFVVIANVGSAVLSVSVKGAFARPRPPMDLVTQVTAQGGFSFPSGHALNVMVLYTSLAMVVGEFGSVDARREAIALAGMLIAVMGVSRIYLGVHYPSDVLGGWSLGAAWIWTLWGLRNAR
ncbi:MAG: phosphatase PAP2 family protein [Polyangiales bacterium]